MYTLGELAKKVGGRVAGDGRLRISGVRPFAEARKGDITLAVGKKYRQRLAETAASAVIVEGDVECGEKALLQVANPKLAFATILGAFTAQPFEARGVSPSASMGRDCRISAEVSIYPFVCIGDRVHIEDEVTIFSGVSVGDDCRIGRGSTLHPNVVLYPGVRLGRRVILHGGTVIGADGFGYVFDGKRQVKIAQTGRVEIHDDVEIGANSCVDRATFGATVIERGVKLDNHVHIGHNTRIGENTVIVGCVGVSGSVEIGKNCILAGQSGVIDHIRIGDDVTVMVKTAVTKDVPSGSVISGLHGRDHRQQLRIDAVVRRLPEIYQEWQALKAGLKKAQEKKEEDS